MSKSILNPQQKEAIAHGNGPLLIIAGAGTGKTTVITERIKHLIIDKKVSSKNILALTFTDRAAFEMQERIDILLPYGYIDLWIHTFHSFCDKILRQESHFIGLDNNYKLIAKAESLLLLQDNLHTLGLKLLKPRSNPIQFLDDLLAHFSRLKDEDITPEQYEKWAEKQEQSEEKDWYLELSYAYKEYEQLKVKNSFMDFSDLISNTLLLFRTRKNILNKYQEKFEYILVDEFQDTNYAQNELAILLAGKNKNLTVVADDDQSIYRFRGAAVSNVLQFKKNFPDGKTISLIQNYRSTQEILDAAYQLIQHNNPNRLEIIEHINKKLKSNFKKNNGAIEVIHEFSSIDEADTVTNTIDDLIKHGYAYNDIAILVRANNHALPIIASCKRKKIPYQFLGHEYLFQQEEIKDMISYVLFLSDITDSISLFRVLSMPVFDISGIELNLLTNFSKKNNTTLFSSILENNLPFITEQTQKKLMNFCEMVKKHLEKSKRQSGWDILFDFLKTSGLMQDLGFANIVSAEQEKRIQNITKFFEKIKYFEEDRLDSTIYTLAAWLKLLFQMGDGAKGAENLGKENAISISTVHGSKGLEFPVVFLVSLVGQRFPSTKRSEKLPLPSELLKERFDEDTDFHLQEERRLFYVGMTRAKEKLFFTCAQFYGEGKRAKKISPFVLEALPKHTVKPITKIEKLPIDALFEYKQVEQHKREKTPFKVHTITYSDLQKFAICPLHYKASVIFKIPTPKTTYQNFGISLHKTLQIFYQEIIDGATASEKRLYDILQVAWISEGYLGNENNDRFEDAKKMLKQYYDSYSKNKVIPLSVERSFAFKLKNGVKVLGTIDRIDPKGNGIEIIDYKTGKNSLAAKEEHTLQLSMYALAATKIQDSLFNQKPENITLTLQFLGDNDKKSMTFSKEDLDILENSLVQKIEDIEKSDFTCNKKQKCETCEYQMLCSQAK